jgi:hypothetical protein
MESDRADRRQGEAVDGLLQQVAIAHAAAETELTVTILDRLRESVPEFFHDDDVAHDMRAAVAANVHRVRELLAGESDRTMSPGLPLEAGDLLHTTIQHGIPLIALLEAYRAAQGIAGDWWQHRLETTAPPDLLSPATRRLNQRLVGYIDTAAAEIRTTYEREHRALENSAAGRRAQLVRRILDGEVSDARDASLSLNHPLTGRHVALIAWRTGDAPGGDDATAVVDAIADALGGVRVLALTGGPRTYAWLSTTGELDPGPARSVAVPTGVHVAMSGVHAGLEGFVRARDDVGRVASIMRETAAPASRVVAYEDVELSVLLTRDRDACARFVRRVLGPLAREDKNAQRARRTLEAFLATGGSPTRAAERLGVHRNTVVYRLNALGLAGVSLPGTASGWEAESARRLELQVALRLVDEIGPGLAPSAD